MPQYSLGAHGPRQEGGGQGWLYSQAHMSQYILGAHRPRQEGGGQEDDGGLKEGG